MNPGAGQAGEDHTGRKILKEENPMKKFLSLVLALVMTMSLVTVSAGAKDFTDDADITYDKAVAVVSAAKIVDGYEDGDFRPTNTLSRGAAAKIICNMILGPTTAAALSADTAPYSDVPTNHTFAGYIAYCQQKGIISGYGDGTFRPAGTLTGYAFMKMLLGALGYDAEIEKYVGPNWSIAVAKQALSEDVDLADGNDNFVGTKAVTREEACLYAFNTLTATMVEYDNNSTVIVGDVTIVNNANRSEVKRTSGKDYTGASESGDKYDSCGTQQFCEKYFSKLTADKSETDDFGRPATKWKYDGDSIGTYADSADESYVLNKSGQSNDKVFFSSADFMQLDTDDFAKEIYLYINGDPVGTDGSFASKKTALNLSQFKDIVNEINKDKGTHEDGGLQAGDIIELFQNGNDDYETICVTRYSVAKIDEVDDSLSSTYTKKGASYSIELKKLNDTFPTDVSATLYDVYNNDSSKELPGFNSRTYTEDTILAVAVNQAGAVLASNVAESAKGTVSSFKTGDKATVKVDGTTYALSGYAQQHKNSVDSFNYDDSTYTVYTDVNGYVIGVDGNTAANLEDVYYVTGVAKDGGMYADSFYAQAVSLKDGTVSEFKLTNAAIVLMGGKSDKADSSDIDDDVINKNLDDAKQAIKSAIESEQNKTKVDTTKAGLYSFDKDGSKYDIKKYEDNDDYTVLEKAVLSDDLKRGDSSAKFDTTKVYLDEETQYIKVEKVGADIDVSTATGGTNVKNENTLTAFVVYSKSGSTKTAEYVVLVNTASFSSNVDASDMVYLEDASSTKNSDGYEVTLIFLDGSGKIEDVTANKKGSDCTFYSYSVDDDGVYELTEKSTALTGSYKNETGFVKDASLTNLYKESLSLTAKNFTAEDVDLAANVVINDERSADDRDVDGYRSEIKTASQLASAIDKDGWTVTANVFFDDEEVIMVSVTSMDKTAEKEAADNAAAVKAALAEVKAIAGEDLKIAAKETALSEDDALKAAKKVVEGAVNEDVKVKVVAVPNSYVKATNYKAAEGEETVVEAKDGTIVVTVTLTAGKSTETVEKEFTLLAVQAPTAD